MAENSSIEDVIKLLQAFKPKMFKTAYGFLNSNADAEDAVQEAFVNIIKSIEKVILIPPGEMGFFFIAVTKNVCRDKLKAKNRLAVEKIDKLHETASDYSVEKAVERSLLLSEVRSAIDRLSDRDRSLIALHFFDELSPKEIAARMNIPEKNIYKYIERARERLVKILNERGIYYDS